MRTLHARSWLARLFLAWYALTLGAAMASPLVQPKLLTQVCSADGGMVLVVVDADGDVVASGPHTLDCALCLATALPAPEAPGAQRHDRSPAPVPLRPTITTATPMPGAAAAMRAISRDAISAAISKSSARRSRWSRSLSA